MKKINIFIRIALLFLAPLFCIGQDALSATTIDATNTECNNGAIDLTIDGGYGLLDIEWLGAGGYSSYSYGVNGFDGQEDRSNLESGMYTVLVTDQLCRQAVLNNILVVCCDVKLTETKINPTYNKDCRNGSINLDITQGVAPYTVQWSFNNSIIQTTTGIQGNNDGEDIANIGQGNYKVSVTDSYCGTIEKTFKLKCECTDYCGIRGEVTPATCTQGGTIRTTIDCEGKIPEGSLTYLWSNGTIQQNLTDLAPGEYCLTVIDQRTGCRFEKCWVVLDMIGDAPTVNLVDIQNIQLCRKENPSCTGSIEVSVPPGTSIEWQNIPNINQLFSPTITDLCSGGYTVNIFSDGCSSSMTFYVECCKILENDITIFEADAINVSGNVSSTTNDNADNGSIDVQISGGYGQIYYNWSGPNGFTSQAESISNLSPGHYCINLMDGCSNITRCFEVYNCLELNLEVTGFAESSCVKESGEDLYTGLVSINVTGGIQPYSYMWNTGSTSSSLGSVAVGNYCVTVTESSGCGDLNAIECFEVVSADVTEERNDCIFTYWCKGEKVGTFDIGQNSTVDPDDCRYKTIRCTDDYYVGEVYTPYVEIPSFESCELSIYCPDDVHNAVNVIPGETSFNVDYGQDANNQDCWYCIEQEICEIDGYGEEILNSNDIVSILTKRIDGIVVSWKVGCDYDLDNIDEIILDWTDVEQFACSELVVHNEYIDANGDSITVYKIKNSDFSKFEYSIDRNINLSLDKIEYEDKENTSTQVFVYPNPFNSLINIDVKLIEEQDVILEIYSFNGEKLKHVEYKSVLITNKVVDLEGLSSGIYLLRIVTNSEVITKKIIKI